MQNERQTITCTNNKLLSTLGLTLIHVSKRGPRSYNQNGTKINEVINGVYLISSSAWYLPRSYEKYMDNRTAYLRTHHSSFSGRTPLHIWHRGKRLCRNIFHSFDPDWCSILKIRWYQSAVRENHITLVYINICRAEFILHNMKIY